MTVKRRLGDRPSVPDGQQKLVRKRRRIPPAMLPYVKPRRRRHQLSGSLPSSRGGLSQADDFPAKSGGRFTSASIVSRYRSLDRQRSRRMLGGAPSAETGSRPSTRSQTAALMHRQLVLARSRSSEDAKSPFQVAEPISASHSAHPGSVHLGDVLPSPSSVKNQSTTHPKQPSFGCGLSPESKTSGLYKWLEKKSPSEMVTRRSDVKKETLKEEAESDRSMRRFVRRRNVDGSTAGRGEFDNGACGCRHGSVVRMSVFGEQIFPDLCPICG